MKFCQHYKYPNIWKSHGSQKSSNGTITALVREKTTMMFLWLEKIHVQLRFGKYFLASVRYIQI